MNGKPVTEKEVRAITTLRETGHSLPEIMRMTKRGSSTVFKHIKRVEVMADFKEKLKIKQGGSKKRAEAKWSNAAMRASDMIPSRLTEDQTMFLMIGLYWGEGNKRELNLMNSDPAMIKIFIEGLHSWGIDKESIKIGLRIHSDIDKNRAVAFWSTFLEIAPEKIRGIEVIEGKKKGRLKYGMCRVRVAKSAPYFKLLMSLINEVKLRFNAAVVQRIEQGTPKP